MVSAVKLYSARLSSSSITNSAELPPILFLFLHGVLAHGSFFFSLAQRLKRACATEFPNRRVELILIDVRNHGRSPHTATHTLDEIVMDIQNWLEEEIYFDVDGLPVGTTTKSSSTPILLAVGHSMGSLAWSKFLMGQQNDSRHRQRHVPFAGFVSLDMPPLTGKMFPSSLNDELCNHLNLMRRVDLSSITDTRSAYKEFDRCGIKDNRVRGFLTTNLQIVRPHTNSSTTSTTRAFWKCNIPVLDESLRQHSLFFSEAFYDSFARSRLEVPVISILGGMSPIGGNAQYRNIWPRFADTVEEHLLHNAGHSVHYDDVEGTAQLMKGFLKTLGIS